MGVHGLWPIVNLAAKQRNFAELVIREGFESPIGVRAYRLGVDVSIWFEGIQQARGLRPNANTGQNAVLQTFFWRLVYLHSHCVIAFFVFEGEGRAEVKRGKHITKLPHWMTNAATYLIEAFGFQSFTALGEAEAELAAMSHAGRIDAIVTNDIDTFVFGGCNVMRTWNIKKDKGMVTTYSSTDIVQAVTAELTQHGCVLFALLSGGDYDSGLQGCGPQTALGVVKYGLAQSLCTAASSKTRSKFDEFLVGWRQHLREVLLTDPEGLIGRLNPTCAANISDGFPNPDVVYAYLSPLNSITHGDPLPFVHCRLPDVARIGELCERYFEWATQDVILPQFTKHVWPGVILRMIRDDILKADEVRGSAGGSSAKGAGTSDVSLVAPDTIPNVIRSRTLASGIPEVKVRFPVAALIASTLSALSERIANGTEVDPKGKKHARDEMASLFPDVLDVWVPATVFRTWILGPMSSALLMGESEAGGEHKAGAMRNVHLDHPPNVMISAGSMPLNNNDRYTREADINLTTPTPTPPPPHCVPTINNGSVVDLTTPCVEGLSRTTGFSDGVIIDLTHDDKIIYDLTGM